MFKKELLNSVGSVTLNEGELKGKLKAVFYLICPMTMITYEITINL